jgi:hypothetical protein
MIIKVNYTISNPIIKITYDETPIYVSTTSNPIYVSVNYGTGGSGTVTSVGLTMPSGFVISGSPITTSGTLLVTGAGTTSQYLRGDGSLATFPSLSGYVPTSRTLTINGASYDLSADRSWTISGTSPLTTKGDIFVRSTVDARLPIGLDTQVLIADSSTSTGLKWGDNTTATPTGYYGAWQDNNTQSAASSNVGYAMIFRTIDLSNGVIIVSNGTNLTRITFANTGIYNLQFSSQFQNLSNAPQDVTIWLRKNGVDVPGSSGFVGLEARKNPGDPYHIIASWNYLLNIVSGDYYELIWSTTDSTNVTMQYYAAGSPPPATASVILTVTQQSGIMAGTGITAINSLTGAAQTLVTGTSGTDFAISSSGTAHTFNLPTASASNRGLLSSSDWTTFNSKVSNNIYTANGTLTSARTVTSGGFNLTFTGSNTASSALATGILINHTLIAAANSDFLVGLNVNPTFTLGAFTGVSQIAYRGQVANAAGKWNLYMDGTADNYLAGKLVIGTTTVSTYGIDLLGTTLRVQKNSTSLVRSLFVNDATGNNQTDIQIGRTDNTQTVYVGVNDSRYSYPNAYIFPNAGVPLYLIGVTNVTNGALTVTSGADNCFNINRSSSGILSRMTFQTAGTINWYMGYRLSTNVFSFTGTGTNGVYNIYTSYNFGISNTMDEADIASAILHVTSTTKGFLPPRMTTTQKNAITSPAAGLIVYDSTLNKLCVRTASAWETITSV